MKEKYHIYGFASALYAVLLTFCLYHNTRGVTFPFFVAGTLYYFYYTMKKSERVLRKDSWFYVISLLLLGTSVFLTTDSRIITIAKLGIFLLFTGFLLHHFYQDEKWTFIKYLQSILEAVIYAIGSLFAPVNDLFYYLQNRNKPLSDAEGNPVPQKESQLKYVLYGIVIAIPLLIVVTLCLSKADLIFSEYISRFLSFIKIETIVGIVFMMIAGYFFSYAVVHSLLKKEIREECLENKTREPVLAITFTSVITLVYLLFCGIQIIYLFSGNMTLPNGYTYAEYARQGFYELLFVCLINLVILLVCVSLFKKSRILNSILCIITICTYIMIASCAFRMYLYVSVYYLTFLRLMVFFFLFVIAVLMAGAFCNIMNHHFPLFRYSMIVITIFTVILAYSHPDYLIASYNINHMETSASLSEDFSDYNDVSYLIGLSKDCAPVLLQKDTFQKLYQISPQKASEYYTMQYYQSKKLTTVRTFNLSEYLAKKTFYKLSPTVSIHIEDYPEYSSDFF